MTSSKLIEIAWTQAWQLTLLIAVVAVIARTAAKRHPHLAHVLWLVVLAKCLTPPVMASPGGVFCWLQAPRAAAVGLTASNIDVPGDTPAIGELKTSPPYMKSEFESAQTVPLAPAPQYEQSIASTATNVGEHLAPAEEPRVASLAENSIGPQSAAHSSILEAAMVWCGALWVAGSAVVIAIAMIRLWSCIRTVRISRSVHRPDIEVLLVDLTRRLKLRRRVRLVVTESRIGPAVVGWLRPTILLPAVAVEGRSARDLESLLAHELIHVRRGDLWIGMWQLVAQAVWWFHPLVWLANRLATRTAEACCDEEVIAELACEPERYARSLLEILEQKRGLISVPAFPGLRPVDVTRERLECIMQLGQGCRRRTPWWCWLVLLLAAVATLPGAAFIAAREPEKAQGATAGPATEQANADLEQPEESGADNSATLKPPESFRLAQKCFGKGNWANSAKYQFRTKSTVIYFKEIESLEPAETVVVRPFAMILRSKGKPADEGLYSVVSDSAVVKFDSTFEINNHQLTGITSAVLRGNVLIRGPEKEVAMGGSFEFGKNARRAWNEGSDAIQRDPWDTLATFGTLDGISIFVPREAESLAAGFQEERSQVPLPEPTTDQSARKDQRAISVALPTDAVDPANIRAKQMPAQALSAEADEITEGVRRSEDGEIVCRIIKLRKNVRLNLQDGSIKATSDRATIVIRSTTDSQSTAELRIELSGNVHWTATGGGEYPVPVPQGLGTVSIQYKSFDLEGSADESIVTLRATYPNDRNYSHFPVLYLAGGARLAGPDYSATADRIYVETSVIRRVSSVGRPVRIVLEGAAAFSQPKVPGGDGSRVEADRLEFTPYGNELTADGTFRAKGKAASARIVANIERSTFENQTPRQRRNDAVQGQPNSKELTTRNYSVADLAMPMQHLRVVVAEDGTVTTSKDVQPTTNTSVRPGDESEKMQANLAALITLIESTVAAESWEIRNGPGSIMSYRTTLSLVIRQTQAVHDELADHFGQLHQLHSLYATLHFEVISVAGPASKSPLKMEKDPAETDEGAISLSKGQLKSFRELIEKSEGVALMNVPGLTLSNGQGAELKLRRRRLNTTEATSLPPLQVVSIIAADRSAIRLQIAAGATKPLDVLALNNAYLIKKGQSLLVDMTDELSGNNLTGMVGVQARAIRRQQKVAPGERVLLLITPRMIEDTELLGVDLPTARYR